MLLSQQSIALPGKKRCRAQISRDFRLQESEKVFKTSYCKFSENISVEEINTQSARYIRKNIKTMIKSLSILMPSYNNNCYPFVAELQHQAELVKSTGFSYEILVADDGSTDLSHVAENSRINQLAGCRYIRREKNVGRAAIRNFLAREAKGEYLLFLDSDRRLCRTDFISTYLQLDGTEVACGGLHIGGDAAALHGNLRYMVEKKYELHNTPQYRQEREYQNFNTSNFMVRRDILLAVPFDERFRRYGYEDVMWGKQLSDRNIRITHIDNPIMLDDFETNEDFVVKMETGMNTLHSFRDELTGYSAVLVAVSKLHKLHLCRLFAALFRVAKKAIRRNLAGNKPIVLLLNVYKLGVYVNIK